MTSSVFRTIRNSLGDCSKIAVHTVGTALVKPFVAPKSLFPLTPNGRKITILYITLAFRGDLVLSFPAISALKRRFPEAELTCWVRGYNESLAELDPDIDRVIVYDKFSSKGMVIYREIFPGKRHRYFLNWIRENQFDVCIDDSGCAFSAIACAYAHIPFRIGRNRQGFGFLFHHDFPYDFNAPLIAKKLVLLRPLGITTEELADQRPSIKIPDELRQSVNKKVFRDGCIPPYFTVQPFAGWAAKNWDDGKLVNVVRQFSSESGLMPVFIGGKSEQQRIDKMIGQLRVESLNSAGILNIAETAGLIAGASFHLGVDSIGGHLAASVGCKSLTLFGPTNPRLIAILTPRNITVLKKTSCTPADDRIYCCRDAGRNCRHMTCMDELEVDEVSKVLKAHWDGEELPQIVVL